MDNQDSPTNFTKNFVLDDEAIHQKVNDDVTQNLYQLIEQYEFVSHVQCSALTGHNVKKVFDDAIVHVIKKRIEEKQQAIAKLSEVKEETV